MRNLMFIVIGVLVLVGGYFLIASASDSARERAMERSVMGNEALRSWLAESDVQVVKSNPRLMPLVETFSIRILPLADVSLNTSEPDPKDAKELFYQKTQRDMTAYVYGEKLFDLPSLVILPKWRTGFASVRVADESVMIPQGDLQQLLPEVGLSSARLIRQLDLITDEKQQFGDTTLRVAIYRAQVFDRNSLPRNCTEVVGIAAGALMLNCVGTRDFAPVHFISDPDLMNNHGLSLGENARFPALAVAHVRGDDKRPVYLDFSPDLLLSLDETEGPAYERDMTDMARLLTYPFSAYWGLLAVALAISFWRGAVRFGPAIRVTDTENQRASKMAAIEAKARLLRLAGQDQRMVAEFVRSRMQELSVALLGAKATPDGLRKVLTQRDPALAVGVFDAAQSLTDPPIDLSPTELLRKLEQFKINYERASHAVGRV